MRGVKNIFAANCETPRRGFGAPHGAAEAPKPLGRGRGGLGSRGWMAGKDVGEESCDVWGATAVARGDCVPSRSPPVAGRRGERFPNQTSPSRSRLTKYVSGYFRRPGKAGRTNNAFAMVTARGGPQGAAGPLFWFGFILLNCYFRINGLAGWGRARQSRCSGEKSFCSVRVL